LGALTAHLERKHVFTGLPPGERDDVIRELLNRIVDAGTLSRDDSVQVLRGILKRERLGTTAIGRGVAIPHCKTANVSRPLVAYGRTIEPIEFGSTDGEGVHSIFLVVSRPEDADAHVSILKVISRGVREDYYARILRSTSDPDLLHDLFREMDAKAAGAGAGA
jgi:mannitol/fructose-specific phosphotransferase system IIA component (Ntr-type)